MDETVNKRISLLIHELTGGRQTMFANKLGVAQSTINSIVGSRQTKPGFDLIDKLKAVYPQVNIEWLVTGEGEMFLSNKPADGGNFGSQVEQMLREEVKALKRDKEALLEIIRNLSLGKDKVAELAAVVRKATITVSGKSVEISTKIKTTPDKWVSRGNGYIRGSSDLVYLYNTRLSDIRVQLTEIYRAAAATTCCAERSR